MDYGESNIYNVDETRWFINTPPSKILVIKGSSEIKCFINGNTKAGFSVLATICADRNKLPLTVLAKGKNEKILKKKYQDKNQSIIKILFKKWTII